MHRVVIIVDLLLFVMAIATCAITVEIVWAAHNPFKYLLREKGRSLKWTPFLYPPLC